MDNENIRFNLNGYYLNLAGKSPHSGKVIMYPDRKLLGVIDTHYFDGSHDTRLLLGVYNAVESSVKFMKIPQPGTGFVPVFYSLTSETLSSGEVPSGNYRGFWFDVGNLPLFPVLFEAVSRRQIKITPELEKFTGSDLEVMYFNNTNVPKLEQEAFRLRQKGFLGFERCPELSEVVG